MKSLIPTDQTALAIENVDSFQRCAFLCASDAKQSCRGFNTQVSGDEVTCERVMEMENGDLVGSFTGYKINELSCVA